jgi:hypothetical protein
VRHSLPSAVFENYKSSPIWGFTFSTATLSYKIHFDKDGWATFWVTVLKNSSGHPDPPFK